MSNMAYSYLPLETTHGTVGPRLVSQGRVSVESTKLFAGIGDTNPGAQPPVIEGIVHIPGVYGGLPCIEGHRIAVHDIVEYIHQGYTPGQIVAEIYPQLSETQVYNAVRYYYEHQQEIDREIAEDIADVKKHAQEDMSPVAQRLRQHIKERREERLGKKGQGA